ncbi:hypothetical protein M9H77_04081 [Catharanthus roseus]|uniref:Uncharacterized protein n=1 Tax=Catharanthus roseus TaxID=4058 RepID=A0ACC0CCZ6_CATRO|nr:hypothetical protein M9H77_04081 [Catharanthus roseus]
MVRVVPNESISPSLYSGINSIGEILIMVASFTQIGEMKRRVSLIQVKVLRNFRPDGRNNSVDFAGLAKLGCKTNGGATIQTEQFRKSHVPPHNILRFFREQNVGCAVRYVVLLLLPPVLVYALDQLTQIYDL